MQKNNAINKNSTNNTIKKFIWFVERNIRIVVERMCKYWIAIDFQNLKNNKNVLFVSKNINNLPKALKIKECKHSVYVDILFFVM